MWQWESNKEEELKKEQEIADAEIDIQIGKVDAEIDSWEEYLDELDRAEKQHEIDQEKMIVDAQLGTDTRVGLLNKEVGAIGSYINKLNEATEALKEMQAQQLAMSDMITDTSLSGFLNYDTVGATGHSVYKVNSNSKAPEGLDCNDLVVTAGGTYKITAVNGDGSYQSQKVSEVSTKNYTGDYANASNSNSNTNSGGGSGGGSNKKGNRTISSVLGAVGVVGGVIRAVGGFVNGLTKKHDGIESGLLGDVPIDPKKELFVKALKGEGVFTQAQMNNGAELFNSLGSLANIATTSLINNQSQNTGDTFRINTINVTTDNATNFVNQLKNKVAITGKQ